MKVQRGVVDDFMNQLRSIRVLFAVLLLAPVLSCVTAKTKGKSLACGSPDLPMIRLFLALAGSDAEGPVIQDPSLCARAAAALPQETGEGRAETMLLVKRRGGGYYAMPASGPSSAGEFSCIALMDSEMRYLHHRCG